MDTQKLHDLIDKVIGKTGPLRTPAWWMRKVLKNIVNKAENDISKLREEVDVSLSQKFSQLKGYTYRELFDMATQGKLIEGQQYKLKDYEPIISLDAIYDHDESKLPTVPSSWHLYFKGIVLTATSAYSFSLDAVYLYQKYDIMDAYQAKFIFAASDMLDYEYNSYCRHNSTYNTFKGKDKDGNYRELTFIREEQNPAGGVVYFYKDSLTDSEVIFGGLRFMYEDAMYLCPVGASFYINGTPIELEVSDFTFRVKGTVTQLVQPGVFDVCYDGFGLYNYNNRLENCHDVVIKGSYYGNMYFPYIQFEENLFNTKFINCYNINLTGSENIPAGINSPNNTFSSASNSKFERCENIQIKYARDTTMVGCSSIQSSYGVINDTFVYVQDLKLASTYDGYYFNASKKIKKTDGIQKGSHVNVIQDTDGNQIFPETKTSVVIDEASGKTLDTLTPLYIDISNLSGSAITQEFYDSLSEAIDAGRPVVVGGAPNYTTQSAVVIRDTLEIGLIHLIMLVITDDVVTTVAYALRANTTPMLTKQWHMVSAGEGLEIGDDGTIRCTLDTNPFIIVPNGVLPESGESGKIYLIPASIVGDQNVMLEYVWVNNAWEKFGEFATNIDLSDYALKSEVATKISDLENDKGYLIKIVLTQAEYDALETKDPNALYVISDANETEDNNFVTEAQLESRGFLTQTDRSELKEYDDFLLGKISDLESKLAAALGRIATLESELENTLKV